MKITVSAYHANNIVSNDYHENDHMAFEQDLKLIYDLGLNILSAHNLVKWIRNESTLDSDKEHVVLTFDDGSELDFFDWDHPTCGFQKSFFTIMNNFEKNNNQSIHATSFVIASPHARKNLEQTCLGGYELWGDTWWQKAENSKLISIENHSWDHLHPTLDRVKQKDNIKGDFSLITDFVDANNQIKEASNYIDSRINSKKTSLFAYPYGHFNSFLVDEYFPKNQTSIRGAFICNPQHVGKNTNVWEIPRFVCGDNWKNLNQLKGILT